MSFQGTWYQASGKEADTEQLWVFVSSLFLILRTLEQCNFTGTNVYENQTAMLQLGFHRNYV